MNFFVYECKNCGGEFYSRRHLDLGAGVVFCPACQCDMYLVSEPKPNLKEHPLSIKNFEARARALKN